MSLIHYNFNNDTLYSASEDNEEKKAIEMISFELNRYIGNLKKSKILNKQILYPEEYTPEQVKIIETDIPERLISIKKEEIDITIEFETETIVKLLKDKDPKAIRDKVRLILKMINEDFFEPPFICYYRSYLFEPQLTQKDIWRIAEYDKEIREFTKRKNNIKKLLQDIKIFLDIKNFKVLEERFLQIDSNQILTDYEKYFKYLININRKDDVDIASDDLVKKCLFEFKLALFPELSRKFTINPFDFERAFISGKPLNIPEPDLNPKTIVIPFINTTFNNEIKVLSGVSRFLASELFHFPFVKNYLRNFYYEKAYLTTNPTEDGINILDVIHPLYHIKRIFKKPIKSFNDDLFLEILHAEEKKLIQIEISVDPKEFTELAKSLDKFYSKEEFTIKDETEEDLRKTEWNILRREAIRILIKEFVQIEFVNEVRMNLREEARDFLLAKIREIFGSILKKPRLKLLPSEKLISIVVETNLSQTFIEILDENGCNSTVQNIFFNNNWDLIKEKQENLINILKENNVKYIVIGLTEYEKCKKIYDSFLKLKENNELSFKLIYGDMRVPLLSAKKAEVSKNMNNSHMNLHSIQSMSLGRFILNPSEETLSLWDVNNYNYLPAINFHPMQNQLNQKKLVHCLELEALKVCSYNGVNINKIVKFPHLSTTLKFICGLGQLKAKYLLDQISNLPSPLTTKSDLKKFFGEKVYDNCSGFIQIDSLSNPLENTFLHPDSFEVVQKIDDKKISFSYEKIYPLINNEKIYVNNFFEFIMNQKNKSTENFSFEELDLKEFFRISRKCDKGYVLKAKVITCSQNGDPIKCLLENGIEAFLNCYDIQDQEITFVNRANAIKQFQVGYTFLARVKEILFIDNELFVYLTTKASHLETHSNYFNKKLLCEHFVFNKDDIKNNLMKCDVPKFKRKYETQFFKNFTQEKAEEYLSNKPFGSFIFHPSEFDQKIIILTIKLNEKIFNHVEIFEKQENVLIFNKFHFNNFENIIEGYLNPYSKILNDVLNHRKFLSLSSDLELSQRIREDLSRDAKNKPYFFYMTKSFVGGIYLGYFDQETNLVKEKIEILCTGLSFHGKIFGDLNKISDFYKKNFNTDEYNNYIKKIKINEHTEKNNALNSEMNKINENEEDFKILGIKKTRYSHEEDNENNDEFSKKNHEDNNISQYGRGNYQQNSNSRHISHNNNNYRPSLKKKEFKIYPECIYCKKTNHDSDSCFFKNQYKK